MNAKHLLGIALILAWSGSGGALQAQISPGPLAAPHAHIEGLQNCTRCHEVGKGPSVRKCLACHQEIQQRLTEKRGFHWTIKREEKKACFSCHGEHAGRKFQLVFWPDGMKNFDHTKAGYRLEGKHAGLECRKCHKPELVREDLKSLQPRIDLARTFLGLQPTCLGCHGDEHRGQLGKDCLQCHNQEEWKPAAGFDHDRARFKLTGRHRKVGCAKCHPSRRAKTVVNGRTLFVKYRGLQFRTCGGCHRDVHEGKFGADCRRCHNTTGWRRVNRARFDHSKTRFPLRGRHANVACEKCHTSGNFVAKIKFQRCRDCHRDVHRGQFVRAGRLVGCKTCHDENGFLPAHYDIEDHQRSKFPLRGAHLAVACIDCHKMVSTADGGRMRLFRLEQHRCRDCHNDVHRGQFAARVAAQGCTACHNNDDWLQTSFDHSTSNFPLTGKHREVECRKCHKIVDVGTPNERRLFKPIAGTCITCHRDPHFGQFRLLRPVKSCNKCHVTAGWENLQFEHNRDSRFKLENAHARVACEDCHKPVRVKQKVFILYRPINPACKTCH